MNLVPKYLPNSFPWSFKQHITAAFRRRKSCLYTAGFLVDKLEDRGGEKGGGEREKASRQCPCCKYWDGSVTIAQVVCSAKWRRWVHTVKQGRVWLEDSKKTIGRKIHGVTDCARMEETAQLYILGEKNVDNITYIQKGSFLAEKKNRLFHTYSSIVVFVPFTVPNF